MSEPLENTRDTSDHQRFSPEDALALFTQNLDMTLNKHKSEIFKELDVRLGAKDKENSATLKPSPKFRYEANEKQFKFNSERLVELDKALDSLTYGSTGLPAAVSLLEKCTKALTERNKILRIADKYGWDVVDEYVDDPITDNSELFRPNSVRRQEGGKIQRQVRSLSTAITSS